MPVNTLAAVGATCARHVRSSLGRDWTVLQLEEWEEAVQICAAAAPPAALIASACQLTSAGVRILRTLNERGLQPPLIIVLEDTAADTIRRVWRLKSIDADLLFSWTELSETIERRCSARGPAAVMQHIQHRLDVTSELPLRVMATVAAAESDAGLVVESIARAVGRKRSTIYAALSEAGIPGVEQLQVLLRLLRSIDVLRSGGLPADAAYVGGYSGEKAWRQALRSRIGITTTDVREGPSDWKWIVDHWLQRHTRFTAPASQAAIDEVSANQAGHTTDRWTLNVPSRTLEGRRARRTA